jgi:protoporphyrinogen IX oxidase
VDVLNTILLWIHLMGLALGGAAAFGIPVVGSRMQSAAPEMRPTLMGIMQGLAKVGRAGIGLLIISGPLMIWLKYGGVGEVSFWFWIKMVLVILLIAGVIYSGMLAKRIAGGDMSAAKLAPRVGMANTTVLVLIVLTAVLTFG